MSHPYDPNQSAEEPNGRGASPPTHPPDARIAQFCDQEFRRYCLTEFVKIEHGITGLGRRMGSLESAVVARRAQDELRRIYLGRAAWVVTTLIAVAAVLVGVFK